MLARRVSVVEPKQEKILGAIKILQTHYIAFRHFSNTAASTNNNIVRKLILERAATKTNPVELERSTRKNEVTSKIRNNAVYKVFTLLGSYLYEQTIPEDAIRATELEDGKLGSFDKIVGRRLRDIGIEPLRSILEQFANNDAKLQTPIQNLKELLRKRDQAAKGIKVLLQIAFGLDADTAHRIVYNTEAKNISQSIAVVNNSKIDNDLIIGIVKKYPELLLLMENDLQTYITKLESLFTLAASFDSCLTDYLKNDLSLFANSVAVDFQIQELTSASQSPGLRQLLELKALQYLTKYDLKSNIPGEKDEQKISIYASILVYGFCPKSGHFDINNAVTVAQIKSKIKILDAELSNKQVSLYCQQLVNLGLLKSAGRASECGNIKFILVSELIESNRIAIPFKSLHERITTWLIKSYPQNVLTIPAPVNSRQTNIEKN